MDTEELINVLTGYEDGSVNLNEAIGAVWSWLSWVDKRRSAQGD